MSFHSCEVIDVCELAPQRTFHCRNTVHSAQDLMVTLTPHLDFMYLTNKVSKIHTLVNWQSVELTFGNLLSKTTQKIFNIYLSSPSQSRH